MIKIKTLFSGWQEVDRESAKKWARNMRQGITNIGDDEKLVYINSKMSGVQFTEEELNKEEY